METRIDSGASNQIRENHAELEKSSNYLRKLEPLPDDG